MGVRGKKGGARRSSDASTGVRETKEGRGKKEQPCEHGSEREEGRGEKGQRRAPRALEGRKKGGARRGSDASTDVKGKKEGRGKKGQRRENADASHHDCGRTSKGMMGRQAFDCKWH